MDRSNRVRLRAIPLVVFGSAPALVAAGGPLEVRVSPETAPCLRRAAETYMARGGPRVDLGVGPLRAAGSPDVVVGTGAEMTRALEGGDAVANSDVALAQIPWVLSLTSGAGARSLGELPAGTQLMLLGGESAHEARRHLAERGLPPARESRDEAALRSAPAALLPSSLAGPGPRVPVDDVRPLTASAAVGTRASRPREAEAFVRFLASDAGLRAFRTCVPD